MKRAIPPDRLRFAAMGASKGIDDAEAGALRQQFGANLIAEDPPGSFAGLARDTAGDPMIWFLLLTSGLFGALGQYTDMTVLLLAIAPLVGMDFYLHRRTQASIEGLRSVLAATAHALRDGEWAQLPAERLVVGDLVQVTAGQSVPADGVIVAGTDLQAEESSLTGEAYPVSKTTLDAGSPAQDSNWAFAGTRLLTGDAAIRVIFTGPDTFFGEIVHSAIGGPPGRTPLQNAVARLVKWLLLAALILCLLLAAVRLWQGFGALDAFLSAAALAVAAIPEEFPVVLTFFLGVGVYRLARVKVLVRRGVAVENIGRVSVICSDKTGTITEGRLIFAEALPAEDISMQLLMETAAKASRADSGDPLDQAILQHSPAIASGWSRTSLFPFTEGRRRETACWENAEVEQLCVTKGAPETILGLCDMTDAKRATWLDTTSELSGKGQKIIACAMLDTGCPQTDEPTGNFRFAGLIAITDPVRNGVAKAVAEARLAGIQVVMVTGDHPQTARAIATQAGIPADGLTILGDDLEKTLARLSPDELAQVSVVARASPSQKVLLVQAFQRIGKIVAVTGDGVNDAPALRTADVGIAMGQRGTRSAREVSAMVLMNDNFATIIAAISEGRQLFRNLQMSFAFLLMIHLPLVASAALIPFLGFPILYLPAHIVWLELLIHPAAILAFQNGAASLAASGPDEGGGAFFSRWQWGVIIGTGVLIGTSLHAVFVATLAAGGAVEQARSMALVCLVLALATLVMTLGSKHWARRNIAGKGVVVAAIVSALLLVQYGPVASLIHLQPVAWPNWLVAAVAGTIPALASIFFRTETVSQTIESRTKP